MSDHRDRPEPLGDDQHDAAPGEDLHGMAARDDAAAAAHDGPDEAASACRIAADDAAADDDAAAGDAAADRPADDDDRGDCWQEFGAVAVTGDDLAQGRSPVTGSAPTASGAAASADDASADEPATAAPPARRRRKRRRRGRPDPVALALDTGNADDVTATDAEAKWNEEAERRAPKPSRSRVIALWSTRSLIGLVAIGAATALGFAAVWALDDGPVVDEPHAAERFTSQSGTQQIVCPPGQVRIGSGGEAGVVSIVGHADRSQADIDGAQAEELPLEGVDDATVTVISAPAAADTISAVQRSSASTEEVRGVGLASCTAPSWNQWLVGGSTATGRQTSVVLANASERTARVSLDAFDANGQVGANATQVIIEAGTAQVLDLASVTVGNESPAVRVTSEGGPVAAFLQQSTIRGLEPGGIDTVESTVAVDGVQTIVGVPIAEGHSHGDDDHGDTDPALRLVADGEDAEASITFAAAGAEPVVTNVRVAADTVFEMPLGELDGGSYSITIDSDAPLAAGVRFAPLSGSETDDFAWLAPARAIDGTARVEIPWSDRDPELHVLNSTAEMQTYVIDGTEHELDAGELLTVDSLSGVVELSGEGLRAAVTYSTSGRAAAFTLQPSPTAAASVAVEF